MIISNASKFKARQDKHPRPYLNPQIRTLKPKSHAWGMAAEQAFDDHLGTGAEHLAFW